MTQFEGFEQPTRNYFPMPNQWTDITSNIDSLAELKVVEYVLRHTWGYREFGITKTISTDEFMYGRRRNDGSRIDKGTGLSKQSVIDGVKKALEEKYLVCEIDSTDKARVQKSYALNMSPVQSDVKEVDGVNSLDIENGSLDTRHLVSTSLTSGVNNLDIGGLDTPHRSEKDTRERHYRKTLKKESDSAPDIQQSLSSSASASSRAHLSKEKNDEKPVVPKTERPAREPAPKRDLLAEASPEAQAVVAQWRAIFKRPVAITKTLIEHATTLAAFQPEPGEIAQCRTWMYSVDRNKWYSSHGMHLGDLAEKNFEKFRSLGDVPEKNTGGSPPEHDRSEEARAQADEENRINFEKWEARNRRLDAEEKALKKGSN